MSWVSQANLKSIMTAIRNKFTTGDLVIANDAKDTGVELNHTAQDGLVTVSPISTDASVESALHLSNGDDSKKTELTQGTLSYVTGTGDSEAYNYMSLLGDGVTFGKKGGGNVQVGGVATPTSDYQAANKKYVNDSSPVRTMYNPFLTITKEVTVPANSLAILGSTTFDKDIRGSWLVSSSLIYEGGNTDCSKLLTFTAVRPVDADSGYIELVAIAYNPTSSAITVPTSTVDFMITARFSATLS